MPFPPAKNVDCQPIFVTRKRRVFNQSGHENRWLYPIFRAHCTSATGRLDHLCAVDDVADIALEIAEERQPIAFGLDQVVDFNSLRF